MLKSEDFIQAKLIEVGWRFGRHYHGGFLASQMVMSAVANRVRAGWGAWLDVIDRVPMYMAETELPPLKFPSIWEPDFVKLLHSVSGTFEGSAQDLTKGGLYWCDLNGVEREWFREKIIRAIDPSTGLRKHEKVADFNSLSFFK